MNTQQLQGFPLTGRIKVQDREFVTACSAEQLLRMITDPRISENPKAREAQAGLQELYELRQQIQRMFEGAKKSNVADYASYIAEQVERGEGVTPQIVLYTPNNLEIIDDVLYLPWSEVLVAIDGETQLAARFEAAKIKPSTLKQLVDVRLCYGYPMDWARQSFYDLNMLSIRPNTSLTLSMDERDPVTKVVRKVAEVPLFRGRVANTRQLAAGGDKVVTISALRKFVVCALEGIAGLKHGNRPVVVPDDQIPALESTVVEFFESAGSVLGPAIEKHEETVATTPPVMAALGAIAHTAFTMPDPEARTSEIQREVLSLAAIDFKRDERWAGIAGQMKLARTLKSGRVKPAKLSFGGGAKDSGGSSFKALADPASEQYVRVRNPSVSVAA